MSSATPSPDPRSSAHGHHKRHSILPAVSQSGPKPPVQFSSSCTVADSALLTGPHTIIVSTESVIHPRARLESLGGRVTVGRRCIVHERACLGAADLQGRYHKGSPDKDGRSMGAVTLGDYVTVEVGAQVESGGTVIGEGTTVGIGTRVGAGAVVGKHCTLTANSIVAAGEVIPDYTVIYSNGLRRVDKRGVSDLKNKAQARQIDVLRRMIPSNPAKFQ
ncbi:hypothetical protein SMACR_07118 [Sordaria macrospora]|uniref:Dynactin subunit 6 n=2 Tax=Sordaria macrospora TaxID=5147 RepID=F7W7L0_SORMK|nr:uncharacterized protein SMAC_07118 [Sordaria macrospora k-hell]KAA8633455.1 hypothetical protein SMACR_07118 [Sordaria macrospora]KAH7630249.1 trimeric LpxA-like protein [Sordaria sp. MPI-SDFR-AT-0083]WPJ66919.1 hypothetical protein SMAC4_07118 [Sordaria macrospora]CCC13494.1 unnamed protein product [Sordaria macrospora k-hell]